MKSFKELIVWQKSHKFTVEIYKITGKFPQQEKFGMVQQLRRAASSILANIAEGFSRKSIKEYIQFLFNARGSLAEVEYFVILALDLNYISSGVAKNLNVEIETVGKMLNGLIKSLNRK